MGARWVVYRVRTANRDAVRRLGLLPVVLDDAHGRQAQDEQCRQHDHHAPAPAPQRAHGPSLTGMGTGRRMPSGRGFGRVGPEVGGIAGQGEPMSNVGITHGEDAVHDADQKSHVNVGGDCDDLRIGGPLSP